MRDMIRLSAAKFMFLALLVGMVGPAGAGAGSDNRTPDVGEYEKIEAPEGHKVAFATYAEGVQIYRWNGTGWSFVGPEAVLYDQEGEVVGIHYGGPTWESNSGSKVKAALVAAAPVDPDAIPWLLLGAVSSEGPGIFNGVTYIQRVYTEGGLAPSEPGDFVGEEARVPYAAEYYFYRQAR